MLVDGRGETFVFLRQIAAHGVLQFADRFRRPGMFFAAQAERIVAADIQHVVIERRVAERVAMTAHGFFGDFTNAGAFDDRGGAGEIFLDKSGAEPDRVEDLRAAIGLIGGDAHFGHHLQNTFADSLDEVLAHVIGADRQFILRAQLLQRFEREIRIDGFGAIASQHAEMMHFPGFAGFDHKPRLHP